MKNIGIAFAVMVMVAVSAAIGGAAGIGALIGIVRLSAWVAGV